MPATERPSERRSAIRTAVVWDALRPVLDAGPLDVLDIGGGTGGSAVAIAERGHRVTVVDPSPDALASLGRRARERGVEVAAVQGDLSTTPDVLGADGADLVLCHGVLEVVDDPAAALATLRTVLREGGALSLLVAQRHAAVLARAMAGHFVAAREALEPGAPLDRAGRRFTHDELDDLVAAAGFADRQVHAVRVFADLVPGALLDAEPGATTALLELERSVASRPEYLPLATQLHLLAR
ncbi:methyltransferase domain-containing protein [Nocardioides sp. AX2bis]|uniref:methyltransferase domain-containing protein n=1 Tax=Nocardioides sp. AX2bis TaxID=2653157 RepID=UPI0012F0EF66|nr:methyltransferase domain-containing protein [Nocardioides sp. AX2bis]VXB15305.1 2-polyprenyl-3-methyl-5-hydroxy-6-metoxy-1, 4-benzoquinol methylase [Nocardioides sp. AX2bis]